MVSRKGQAKARIPSHEYVSKIRARKEGPRKSQSHGVCVWLTHRQLQTQRVKLLPKTRSRTQGEREEKYF